jgi:hypothetical protein
MIENKWILVGIVTGFAALYLLKKYCAGGKCTIQKDLTD